MQCQCHSGLPYLECCGDYHTHKMLPESALVLMRSRFSAYARTLPNYIIETTHPDNPACSRNRKQWCTSIEDFCKRTDFRGLNIIEFVEGDKEAFVTFYAHLIQDNEDVSFIETSRFIKVGDRWLYLSGHIEKK